MKQVILIFPLFLCFLVSCSIKDDLSIERPVTAQLSSSDFKVENNQIILKTSREDALTRGVSDSQFDQTSGMVAQLNACITAFLTDYEREHGLRDLPILINSGTLNGLATNGGTEQTGSILIDYGDSFTVIAAYSDSMLYGGRHKLTINWAGGSRDNYHNGNGTVQYFFNYQQGPAQLQYTYQFPLYSNGQCIWAILGYFND